MVRVIVNGPGERCTIRVDSYQKPIKWYLTLPFSTLSIIKYGSRASGAIQGTV